MKQLDRNWQETPAAVKAAYGDEYFANYRDILRLFIQTKHQRVEDVTETIVEAVQSSEPEFYYRVCYFFDNIINLLETIPEEINDCICKATTDKWRARPRYNFLLSPFQLFSSS